MRGLFIIVASLIVSMALITDTLAQPDCEVLIEDLNRQIEEPTTFDVGKFLLKFGLEYTTCPIKDGRVYCFKCLYKGSVSAVEIALTGKGNHVSPPQYGCTCQRIR